MTVFGLGGLCVTSNDGSDMGSVRLFCIIGVQKRTFRAGAFIVLAAGPMMYRMESRVRLYNPNPIDPPPAYDTAM